MLANVFKPVFVIPLQRMGRYAIFLEFGTV
jgi:hypothetical protein